MMKGATRPRVHMERTQQFLSLRTGPNPCPYGCRSPANRRSRASLQHVSTKRSLPLITARSIMVMRRQIGSGHSSVASANAMCSSSAAFWTPMATSSNMSADVFIWALITGSTSKRLDMLRYRNAAVSALRTGWEHCRQKSMAMSWRFMRTDQRKRSWEGVTEPMRYWRLGPRRSMYVISRSLMRLRFFSGRTREWYRVDFTRDGAVCRFARCLSLCCWFGLCCCCSAATSICVVPPPSRSRCSTLNITLSLTSRKKEKTWPDCRSALYDCTSSFHRSIAGFPAPATRRVPFNGRTWYCARVAPNSCSIFTMSTRLWTRACWSTRWMTSRYDCGSSRLITVFLSVSSRMSRRFHMMASFNFSSSRLRTPSLSWSASFSSSQPRPLIRHRSSDPLKSVASGFGSLRSYTQHVLYCAALSTFWRMRTAGKSRECMS
mmetsp:Transcript_43833/g.89541  ORF Transcript_43833/g.89541 Transcript_43833/m.89541 type:complete len:434 (+) Transcript_43833:1662-2963(+)